MISIRALWNLIRPHNCALAGAAVVVGSLIATEGILQFQIGFSFLAVVLICGGGFAVNDYMDREIDAVNNPWRPIPSKVLHPSRALQISVALFIAGILSSLTINGLCFILACINTGILITYSVDLKSRGLVGNLTIGYLVGSVFLFAGLATGELKPVLFLSVMSALSTAGRELIKDIEDFHGDELSGSSSFPINYGKSEAAGAAVLLTAAAIVLFPIPYWLGIFSTPYLAVITASTIFFIAGMATIARNQQRKDARRSSLFYKIGMGIGLIAFLVGGLM